MLSKNRPKRKSSQPNELRDLFIDRQVTGLCSNAGSAFERTDVSTFECAFHVRPQITAMTQARSDGLLGPARAYT
jgi:hypothetical protein